MIVVIPRSALECKPQDWLPRRCPGCGQMAIIGHGRRRRQAHDGLHEWIRVRRGVCKKCRVTLTVLPAWCVPGARYTLTARQQALEAIARGESAQQAAPHCRDPDRVADASTIRRWFGRRLLSWRFWSSNTLLAFDWLAFARTLIVEVGPP